MVVNLLPCDTTMLGLILAKLRKISSVLVDNSIGVVLVQVSSHYIINDGLCQVISFNLLKFLSL